MEKENKESKWEMREKCKRGRERERIEEEEEWNDSRFESITSLNC